MGTLNLDIWHSAPFYFHQNCPFLRGLLTFIQLGKKFNERKIKIFNYTHYHEYISHPTQITNNLNPLNAIFPLLPYKARILKNNGKLVMLL